MCAIAVAMVLLYAADWAFGWSGLESEPVFANSGWSLASGSHCLDRPGKRGKLLLQAAEFGKCGVGIKGEAISHLHSTYQRIWRPGSGPVYIQEVIALAKARHLSGKTVEQGTIPGHLAAGSHRDCHCVRDAKMRRCNDGGQRVASEVPAGVAFSFRDGRATRHSRRRTTEARFLEVVFHRPGRMAFPCGCLWIGEIVSFRTVPSLFKEA